MTVLTFPTNPTLGQRYNAPNQIQYVFDGVKWIVETVASTSLAVTNSVQDRVAPMFVTGPHTGINFTYNAGTNVISANVTSVNGDSLINGVHELTLESTGATTFPTLTVPLEDNANPIGTGQVLKFSDSTQQAIIFGPVSTVQQVLPVLNELLFKVLLDIQELLAKVAMYMYGQALVVVPTAKAVISKYVLVEATALVQVDT